MAAEIKVTTNEYEISNELETVKNHWLEVAKERLLEKNIAFFDLFYFGNELIMAKIKLTNGNYGDFNITSKRISLCGYTVTSEEFAVMGSLTWNDECYKGTLF